MISIRNGLVALCLLLSLQSKAAVSLPAVIADNMVLQQQSDVELWGKATKNATIKITTSWDGKTYSATVGTDGKWSQTVATPAAGGPYSVTFDDGSATTISNVMVGEVWLCSGQSNMEMPMEGFVSDNQFVDGSEEAIASADADVPIRMFTHDFIADNSRVHDEYESAGTWGVNESSTVAKTSALAYYFARYLQQQQGVPIGIIITACSGSNITQWMSAEASEEVKKSFPSFSPNCVLYNGMMSTLLKVRMRGMLWYQGEANINSSDEQEPEQYKVMMPAFVSDLRQKFSCGEFPFYYVQIAPFSYNSGEESARFREMQASLMDEISNVGMTTTIDIGNSTCIHPTDKETVAKRLAYWALAKTYGHDDVVCESPEVSHVETTTGYAYVYFTNVQGGNLYNASRFISGLELAGDDKVFHKASGYVDAERNRIVVYSDRFCTKEPVAVRYCFKDFACGTLYNGAGIPVLPFRTDSW